MMHRLGTPLIRGTAAMLAKFESEDGHAELESKLRSEAAVHVEAVRAALRGGRLDAEALAVHAGLHPRTVRAWLADTPLGETWEGYAWGAAVTTTVPGWRSPRAAMAPPGNGTPRSGLPLEK